ncbi:hypothetical protein NC652_024252 [Populus alba x Populus x berolinensis]|nr:hypothetical protein NC652_024252 [Populus alba x Populus x berolinensis]
MCWRSVLASFQELESLHMAHGQYLVTVCCHLSSSFDRIYWTMGACDLGKDNWFDSLLLLKRGCFLLKNSEVFI